jgi:hypothetical protein
MQIKAARIGAEAIRCWIDVAMRQQLALRAGLSYPIDDIIVTGRAMRVVPVSASPSSRSWKVFLRCKGCPAKVHFIGRLDGLQLAPTPCPATLQEATACLANHLLETASVPSFLSNENFLLENGRAPFVGQM